MTSAGQKRVLLVDDDADILRLVALVLRSDGYDVVAASNGEDALRECEKEPFSLVLLDLMMPKMDGETFLGRLQARFGDDAPPVVVVSASSERANVARSHGAVGSLEKPFELDDVREMVEMLLLRSSRP